MSPEQPVEWADGTMTPTLGASDLGEGRCQFRVWSPFAEKVEVHLFAPQERFAPLQRRSRGYHQGIVEGVQPGSLYMYRLDGTQEYPDPASRSQVHDVHGPSAVVGPYFPWEDGSWRGLPLRDYILYELHVGTFTAEGTFEAIIPHLDELKDLGITAVELMPVAQFPGSRNWGYDGVYPFAVQASYGGPQGLKRLVNACHLKGVATVLDVVYNHLGPEGNYLGNFGPYFTDRYRTPWGLAVNFDGPDSDEVRRYFIDNALYWITEFHIDALRLDAIHAIMDHSAQPFLEGLGVAVHEQAERLNRRVYVIPESALNDTRVIRPRVLGGYGLDAQWNDDFHHALRVLLTGERSGYYADFGPLQHLVKAFEEGYVYAGEYSPYRRRRHGNSSRQIPAQQFVVFAQNHDQVGNRMLGERLSQLISFEALKLAAGVVLLSPFIPLLFMGEEYGETAPFQYFISHSDPQLVEAVRRGRREEFAAFGWQDEPPDPQAEATFQRAKLSHELQQQGHQQTLRQFYRELIQLRKTIPALAHLSKDTMEVEGYGRERVLCIRRWCDAGAAFMALNFSETETAVIVPLPEGLWAQRIDSAQQRWHGPGSITPERLRSEGEITLPLSAKAVVLFTLLDRT